MSLCISHNFLNIVLDKRRQTSSFKLIKPPAGLVYSAYTRSKHRKRKKKHSFRRQSHHSWSCPSPKRKHRMAGTTSTMNPVRPNNNWTQSHMYSPPNIVRCPLALNQGHCTVRCKWFTLNLGEHWSP
jgi:hypothetical protein